MKTHDEIVADWMNDPKFKNEYDALEEEFNLFDAVFKTRKRAVLTQAKIAARMGTKAPAVARIEAGGDSKHHSPSIATLRRYADAVGCMLKIEFAPR